MEKRESQERPQEQIKALADAEDRVSGERGHCYCGACLNAVADKANDVIWEILNENEEIDDKQREQIYWDMEYVVQGSGTRRKLIHACDLPKGDVN